MKLDGQFLRYYKHEDESGSLDLGGENVEAVARPTEDTDDCKSFEITWLKKSAMGDTKETRRLFFEARSPEEMLVWVESIKMVGRALRDAEMTKLVENCPVPVRIFDTEGEEACARYFREEINRLYPTGDLDSLTLARHLQYAEAVSTYVSAQLLPDTTFVSGDKAKKHTRPDVLAIGLEVVNSSLNSNLGRAVNMDDELISSSILADIHMLLMWITHYQDMMHQIFCPVPPGSSRNPFCFAHFDKIPQICERYINGDKQGVGGAASHLVDHCIAVLDKLLKDPSGMLLQHDDKSFFTDTPTEIWMAFNQHLSLATETGSPVLYILIANKISAALSAVIEMIMEYAEKTESTEKLKAIEVEMLCALANDNVFHIEEIMVVVNNFEMDEIRHRIDEIYDSVTNNLVACGRACLTRLTSIVMADIEHPLSQVFTVDWLDGNQVSIAVATMLDYMNDFNMYLMSFWSEKIVANLLEAVVTRYIKSVVFRTDTDKVVAASTTAAPLLATPPAPAEPATTKKSWFSSFTSSKKSIQVPTIVAPNVRPYVCRAEPEVLGKLAQDVNTLNGFFSGRVGQEKATEFLVMMNELSIMLQLGTDEIFFHVLNRCAEFPSASKVKCANLLSFFFKSQISRCCSDIASRAHARPFSTQ